jgi:hypothetical protein
MMLEMFVTKTDGTSYVWASARDDAAGRRAIDREAWHALSRPGVVSVSVESSVRVGGYR